MEMGTLALLVLGFLLCAPEGSSAGRVHPASQQQAVSPLEDLLVAAQPHINVTASTPGGGAGNYFAVNQANGEYHGFVATLDVYGFSLGSEQLSRTGIWVMNVGDGAPSSANTIQIGWEVSPHVYGDSKTHFFTAWTRDGYKQTGCYNTKCPGFQSESGAAIAPGATIDSVSQAPNGAKQYITIKVIKDNASGDWLVHYGFNKDPELIGRLPKSIFTGLADKATDINFGGQAGSSSTGKPTPMGSGFLAPAAASFSNVQLIDGSGQASLVTRELNRVMTSPSLYPVTAMVNGGFSYGGPSKPTSA